MGFNDMYIYERHIACLLSGICIGLALHSYFQGAKPQEKTENIVVHVVGAVHARDVVVRKGSRVEQVLEQVSLQKGADLQAIYGMRRLFSDATIVVPYEKRVTLFITGAVREPKVVVVDKEARAADLLAQVELTDEADLKRFMRRRRFHNGTVIEIPVKK